MRKMHCFAMQLVYTRARHIEFPIDLKTEALIRQHTDAFQYFGRFTNSAPYGNMKEVVRDRKVNASDSIFNPLFMD